MQTIPMKQFEELLKEKGARAIDIIDLRAPSAFHSGHIAGAKNIPLDQLTEKVSDLDKEKLYYLICYSGSFSAMGTQYLTQNGFKAKNVQSGMGGYSGPTV